MKRLNTDSIIIAVLVFVAILVVAGCVVPLFIAMGRAFWHIALNNYMLM